MTVLKPAGAMLVLLFFLGFNVSSAPAQCPTYQTNLVVDLVNSIPIHVVLGGTVVTRIHVVYPDGTPATLSPETVSFVWAGSAGTKRFDNAPVVPTGDPGFYTYTQTITDDFPTGTVTLSVALCSCSDASGNYGPTSDTNSDVTITPADLSILQIGLTGPSAPTQAQLIATYGVPILVAILLIIALLLLVLRGRKKKT